MIAITGANGQLGELVIKALIKNTRADQIVAAVRNPEKTQALKSLGVQIRQADYDKPETLTEAFRGVEKLLLISAVILGERLRQHRAVIDAAKQAGVRVVAYTSLLRADTSDLALAEEHKATEDYLRNSGMNFIFLRNGWYLENHTAALPAALQNGAIIGSAGDGRFASASRADYADAAAAVLTQPSHENKIYELVGDSSFTLGVLAAEVTKQTGTQVVYRNLPTAEYGAALLSFGLPRMIVDVVIDADLKARNGALNSSSHDLSRLIGRPTTALSVAVATALSNKKD
ncbi:SDR family oxidoreductase [Edaphobacter sp. HDX4]|uniref:SDR family oxidoreductase n=1 Tax=Edaphobacter sp. HDX4 TaxID=2794064 RepID=UPI002FE601B6